MTSKLKCPVCPWCGQRLRYRNGEHFVLRCPNLDCKWEMIGTKEMWLALIQAKQDLEQSEKCCSAWETQALDYKAETIALSGKLEIARQAMNQVMSMGAKNNICYHLNAKTVKRILGKALEQIEHKE